jgi:hypothetical protein
LDAPLIPNEYSHSKFFPSPYEIRAFAGRSQDGRRAALFGVKLKTSCDNFGWFCPSSGKLVVFESPAERLIFERKLPTDGRAELSATGKHLVIVENSRLEIFSLP